MNIQLHGKTQILNKAILFKKRKSQRQPLIDDINNINGWRKQIQFNAFPITLH